MRARIATLVHRRNFDMKRDNFKAFSEFVNEVILNFLFFKILILILISILIIDILTSDYFQSTTSCNFL